MDPVGIIQLKREATDMLPLLQSSLAPLVSQCTSEGIELRVLADENVPRARVDPEKIAWAVSVVVGNALRYIRRGTPELIGGSVLVHVTSEGREGEVSVAVHDDGPGIEEEKLSGLFQRRAGEMHATGLALSLVKDVVEAHGGRIDVASRTGVDEHFTCVTLVLPTFQAAP